MAEEEMRESAERAFQAYSRLLDTVNSFKCLGRILTEAYNNCTVVLGNLIKASKSWARLTSILGR